MATSEAESLLDELPDEPETGASTDWRAESTRLKQRLAQREKALADVAGHVELVEILKKADGGPEIIERLAKGLPLVEGKNGKPTEEEKAAAKAAGLTVAELRAELNDFRKQMVLERNAERAMNRLNEWASKELPGYDDLRQTDEWQREWDLLSAAVTAVNPQTGQPYVLIPEDQPDPYKWMIQRTYRTLTAGNPGLGKLKKAPTTEAERQAGILKGSPKSTAAPETGQDEEIRRQVREAVPAPSMRQVGKSLASLRKR